MFFGGAVTWPLAAGTQPKAPLIGVLVVGSPGSERFWQLFQMELSKLGYDAGRVRFEFRSDNGQLESVRTFYVAPACLTIRRSMAVAGDPVATGSVKSLSEPGGNVTGMSRVVPALSSKTVEFLKEMLPSVRQLTVLANAPDSFLKPFLEQIRLAAAAAGIAINPKSINDQSELDAALLRWPESDLKR